MAVMASEVLKLVQNNKMLVADLEEGNVRIWNFNNKQV
jgi:hypothetical protein